MNCIKMPKKCRCGECKRCELRKALNASITRNKVYQETKNKLLNIRQSGDSRTNFNIEYDDDTGQWVSKTNLAEKASKNAKRIAGTKKN